MYVLTIWHGQRYVPGGPDPIAKTMIQDSGGGVGRGCARVTPPWRAPFVGEPGFRVVNGATEERGNTGFVAIDGGESMSAY